MSDSKKPRDVSDWVLDRFIQILDAPALNNWLSKHQYSIGQHYEDRKSYEEALAHFVRAEQWYAKVEGPEHPHVIAAIVKEAVCNDRLSRVGDACHDYRRALELMRKTGNTAYPTAAIEAYVAANCSATASEAALS